VVCTPVVVRAFRQSVLGVLLKEHVTAVRILANATPGRTPFPAVPVISIPRVLNVTIFMTVFGVNPTICVPILQDRVRGSTLAILEPVLWRGVCLLVQLLELLLV